METLTEGERCGLLTVEPLSTDWRVQKAIRIIDQLSAALADKALVLEKCADYKSKLAAANALLDEVLQYLEGQAVVDRIRAHLAGQPATAPDPKVDARVTKADSAPSTHSTSSVTSDRAAAEQAVLDAMRDVRIDRIDGNYYVREADWNELCEAELARRGLE